MLFRAAHHSDVLEVELARRNIPFVKYGGLKFLESAHVKDALAVLRICDNPRDESAGSACSSSSRASISTTARRLMGALGVEDGHALAHVAEATWPCRSRRRPGSTEFRECSAPARPPTLPRRRCSSSTSGSGSSRSPLRRRSDAPEPRMRSRAARAAGGRVPDARGRFVTELTLDPPSARPPDLAGPPLLDETTSCSRPCTRPRAASGTSCTWYAADRMFLGHGDRRRRPDRGGAPAVLRRAHAGSAPPRRSPSRCATTDAWAVARTATGTRSSRFLARPARTSRTETTYADRADDETIVATPGTSEGVDALLAGLFAPE